MNTEISRFRYTDKYNVGNNVPTLHLSDRTWWIKFGGTEKVCGLREKITILQNYIKTWNLHKS